MAEKVGIGIEIECLLNTQIVRVERGSYHSGTPVRGLPGWTAERDGSLSGYEFDNWTEPVEFVTKVSRSIQGFERRVSNFKKFFSKNGEVELNKVLSFNESCGSHIHFSIENFRFSNKVIFEVFKNSRNFFLERVQNSTILSEEAKRLIVKHYSRSYAKQITKSDLGSSERYLEFNFTSENQNRGIEWRSINMRGIKSWKEFEEIVRIIVASVKFLRDNAKKYEKRSWEKFEIPDFRPEVRVFEVVVAEPIQQNIEINLNQRLRRY